MIQTRQFLRSGMWFVRNNPQSGFHHVTEPHRCLAVSRPKDMVEYCSPTSGRRFTCPLSNVAYVSHSYQDLYALYKPGVAHLESYERVRQKRILYHKQEIEDILTERMLPEDERKQVLGAFTFCPPSGPVKRYISIMSKRGKRVLMIYEGTKKVTSLDMTSLVPSVRDSLLAHEPPIHAAGFTGFSILSKHLYKHIPEPQPEEPQ